MAEAIKLPTQRVKASHQSPKNLIIFSKPKVGKTELLAGLENCLNLDLEKGSDYVEALKIQAETIQEIQAIGIEIKKAGHPYDYIAVDTITALENICIPYAEILYAKTPMGKNWFKKTSDGNYDKASGKKQYGNILNLPNGGGYAYLRQAMTNIIEHIKTWAPRIILVGHIKDVLLEKAGGEFTSSDLDLTGKIKRIISSQSDAIGYLYRKGNQNILSFKTTDEVSCGARPEHLRNKEIVISEMTEEGLVTHWDKVYID
jgi:AAA domain